MLLEDLKTLIESRLPVGQPPGQLNRTTVKVYAGLPYNAEQPDTLAIITLTLGDALPIGDFGTDEMPHTATVTAEVEAKNKPARRLAHSLLAGVSTDASGYPDGVSSIEVLSTADNVLEVEQESHPYEFSVVWEVITERNPRT